MNRLRFMEQLKKELTVLSPEELASAITYYDEYFEDAGIENEQDVIRRLGDPKALAQDIIRESGQPVPVQEEKDKGEQNHTNNGGQKGEYRGESWGSVEISVASAAISFEPSDKYSFQIDCDDSERFEWSVSNGRLKITEKPLRIFNIFSFTAYSAKIIINYPTTAIFQDVKIKSASGGIKADRLTSLNTFFNLVSGGIRLENCRLGRFQVDNVSGSFKADSLTCDKLDLSSVSGSVKLERFYSKGLSLNSTSGSIHFDGKIDGDIIIHSISGGISLDLIGESKDYSKDFKVLSGSVRVNGEKLKGYREIDNMPRPYRMKIDSTSGGITVDFRNK